MTVRHAAGSPNWFELGTTDPASAETFYAGLFGWEPVHSAMPDGGTYTIFRLDGREAAAAYPLKAEQRAQGMPSSWGVYFQVDDADAAAEAVVAAGGRVHVPPFEVMQHLRMAVCADPEGAMFMVGQPRQHPGVGVIREPNAVCWAELATRDLDRADAFYTTVLGWTMQAHHASPPDTYRIFGNADGMLGGLLRITPEWGDIPSHWAIYLQVEDVDAVVERAQALGGRLVFPAFDAPQVGRIARIEDPTGAGFYVIRFVEPA